MSYTLPLHGVYTNAGIDASGNGAIARNDGGAIKLNNELVHDRFRKTVESPVIMEAPQQVQGIDGVSPLVFSVAVTRDATWRESDGGYVEIEMGVAHGLVEGDYIKLTNTINGRTEFRVAKRINSVTIVLNTDWVSNLEVLSDVTYQTTSAINEEVIVRPPVENMRQDKSHAVNAVRTLKTATAIRAGNYNITTGDISPAPSASEDLAGMAVNGVTDGTTTNSTVRLGLKNKTTIKKQRGPNFNNSNKGTSSNET